MLAAALKPHDGIVLWRAFVYETTGDRAKDAFATFKPLDGKFADNVIIQIKNGPIDFQVREPVSPLFGQMPQTNLALELQITQEYLGHSTHLCYLVPQWRDVFDFDTFAVGGGSTVTRLLRGDVRGGRTMAIAGVSNVGADPNWTGHTLAQANLYAFGRLAWDPDLPTTEITDEWIVQTFGHDPQVRASVRQMLLKSWEIYENYTSPLGTGVMSDRGPHYDPAPEIRRYYHGATKTGVGKDRTQATGSGYTAQYHAPVAEMYASLELCPEELLLFFHHVPYTHELSTGQSVIQYIYDSRFAGVEQARWLKDQWLTLEGKIDPDTFAHVEAKLSAQIAHAEIWRDAICNYFYGMSGIPDQHGRVP
jgi:alpha-glucuronidase